MHKKMHKLPTELLEQISMYDSNPITYYNLIQVSKIFKLDTNIMKAKFIIHTIKYGVKYTKLPNGWLHSCNDQPAVINTNGERSWYHHGELHRNNDLPAVVFANGDQFWYHHGELHRNNDLPAVVFANGDQYWFINGKQHRDNDQPAEIYADGDKSWHINGKLQHDTKPTN